ncbi:hypothetical protein WN51_13953 [Melipona quadrifasciata]|uniref:Uncharacterized protein n=1 Tax=Melipona quadrifasciata TaxID=166423 RepID=A0A0M8ZYT9_9HYME|nr:hypothetical protein WN51_13953 [Melipona quadrifasciata]
MLKTRELHLLSVIFTKGFYKTNAFRKESFQVAGNYYFILETKVSSNRDKEE